MRISDWSSDVCSSDLVDVAERRALRREADRLCFCPTAGNWRLPTPEAGSFAIASGHNPSWPFPRHYIALAQPKGGPLAVIDTVSKAPALGALRGKHPVRRGSSDERRVGKEWARTCR